MFKTEQLQTGGDRSRSIVASKALRGPLKTWIRSLRMREEERFLASAIDHGDLERGMKQLARAQSDSLYRTDRAMLRRGNG